MANMVRYDDEYNYVKVTNEGKNPSFEFGSTPSNESASYSDNRDQIRDEVNDNPASNDENKAPEKEKERKQEEQKELEENKSSENSNSGSSGSGSSSSASSATAGASASGSVATIAGVAMVSVTTLSTLVGINLYIKARCKMNNLDITPISLKYELELEEIGEDKIIISLENPDKEFLATQPLVEGPNEGYFEDLAPSTNYALAVIDVTQENYFLYRENIKTPDPFVTFTVTFNSDGGSEVAAQSVVSGEKAVKPEDPTKTGYVFNGWYVLVGEEYQLYDFETPVTSDLTLVANWVAAQPVDKLKLAFDANGGTGTMSSLELDPSSEYSLPVCIFVPDDDVYFGGWQVNGEGETLQPGETIVVDSDTTLVAQWSKFPTQENTVTADRTFFSYFPEQPSTEISSVTLMDIEFQYSNVAYSSNEETLDMYLYDGFISTTTPFAGPIKSITVNSKTVDYDLNMVYSESPIYERVTEGAETQRVEFAQDYTFECTNPDARYFCLSRDNEGSGLASFNYIKFVYETPVIENEFNIYFDANGGSGSFGPYTVRNLNKRDLPDIETIGFTAPDGYEFAGWKVKSVEDLLDAGTVIGISSDITLVAQWKEKGPAPQYTVTFDTNGGSEVTSQKVNEGEYATRPSNPAYNGYEFMEWCYIEENQPLTYMFEEMPVESDITLYAQWQPATTLSFHVDYIDMSQGLLSYTYSISNADDYKQFELYFYCNGERLEESVLINLENTSAGSAFETIELPQDVLVAMRQDENEVVDYHLFGTSQIAQQGYTTDIADGSFSPTRSIKYEYRDTYIGNVSINDQGDMPLIYIGGNYYLPMFIDMVDYNEELHGSNFTLNYNGEPSAFLHSSGMELVQVLIPDYDPDAGAYLELTLYDENNEVIAEPGFTRHAVLAGAGEILGFSLSSFVEGENPTIQIIGMPSDSDDETYRGLGMQSVKLIFDVFSDTTSQTFAADLDLSQNDTPLGEYIEFEIDDYEGLLNAMKNHVTTVTLMYEDASGDSHTMSDFYILYSFQIYN